MEFLVLFVNSNKECLKVWRVFFTRISSNIGFVLSIIEQVYPHERTSIGIRVSNQYYVREFSRKFNYSNLFVRYIHQYLSSLLFNDENTRTISKFRSRL